MPSLEGNKRKETEVVNDFFGLGVKVEKGKKVEVNGSKDV